MKIKECWMIKEIIANKPDDEAGDEITFSNLKILELQQLSSLTRFSSGNYQFKFTSLETIIVSLCPNLKTFSREIPISPKVRRVQVGDQGDTWYWEGNLNATLHKMYISTEAYGKIRKEMNASSEDESSYVSEPALSNTDIDQIEMDKDHHLEDHQRAHKRKHLTWIYLNSRFQKLKEGNVNVSDASLVFGVYAQSKDRQTDAKTNKASLPGLIVYALLVLLHYSSLALFPFSPLIDAFAALGKEISLVWQT
ncbi:hypothetical protein L6164_026262 [Bauhinia variegata]|uniref:Uncharacterized protein n=1 Tax=Bauhinia variegata TaxID=167791 RepID=A0ACB9LPA5_BAUVA|nr:hypothetical protein L6164_026262 [Bauhinia variegata]